MLIIIFLPTKLQSAYTTTHYSTQHNRYGYATFLLHIFPSFQIFRIQRKEIEVQNLGNFQKHISINAVAFENTIAGHTASAKLTRKPSYSAFLPLQFLANRHTYIYITFCHRCSLQTLIEPTAKKDVNRFVCCLYPTSGSGKPS